MTARSRHGDWESWVSRGSHGERVSGSHWVQPGRMWYGGKWSSWCSHGSSGGADAIWRRDAMDQRQSRWRSNCQNGTSAGGGDGQICRRPAELPKLDTRFQEKDKKRQQELEKQTQSFEQFLSEQPQSAMAIFFREIEERMVALIAASVNPDSKESPAQAYSRACKGQRLTVLQDMAHSKREQQ